MTKAKRDFGMDLYQSSSLFHASFERNKRTNAFVLVRGLEVGRRGVAGGEVSWEWVLVRGVEEGGEKEGDGLTGVRCGSGEGWEGGIFE